MPKPARPVLERLMEKIQIDEESGCWFWVAAQNNVGYGVIGIKDGGRWVPRLAHRVSYELHRGAIPKGLHLDHLCRKPLCVNPDHLEPVTNRENVLRGDVPKDVCPQGHAYTAENIYMAPPRPGRPRPHKQCRICRRDALARLSARRQQAA